MSGFMKMVNSRKTTYEFSGKRVKDSDIKKILEAGRLSPSVGNTQPWYFIVIKDKETIKRLAHISNAHKIFAPPPVMLAIVLDKTILDVDAVAVSAGIAVYEDAHISAGTVVLNMAYEAQELGINSAFMSPKPRGAKRILRIPQGMHCRLLVGLGYEKEDAPKRKRIRKPLQKIVFYEKFGNKKPKHQK